MKLDDEDIDELAKDAPSRSSIRATIGTKHKKELMSFQRMITERKENKEPGAKDIKFYNIDDIDDYYNKHSKSLQLKVTQSQSTAAAVAPAVPPKPYSKSDTERELDNWTSAKRDKTAFKVLKDNNKYLTWNEKINVQKLIRMINKNYRMDAITDPFERKLYDEQCTYFWSVLLHSLQNSYILDCTRD